MWFEGVLTSPERQTRARYVPGFTRVIPNESVVCQGFRGAVKAGIGQKMTSRQLAHRDPVGILASVGRLERAELKRCSIRVYDSIID